MLYIYTVCHYLLHFISNKNDTNQSELINFILQSKSFYLYYMLSEEFPKEKQNAEFELMIIIWSQLKSEKNISKSYIENNIPDCSPKCIRKKEKYSTVILVRG
eukprot:UN10183